MNTFSSNFRQTHSLNRNKDKGRQQQQQQELQDQQHQHEDQRQVTAGTAFHFAQNLRYLLTKNPCDTGHLWRTKYIVH